MLSATLMVLIYVCGMLKWRKLHVNLKAVFIQDFMYYSDGSRIKPKYYKAMKCVEISSFQKNIAT